jgi:Na+/proline symporter
MRRREQATISERIVEIAGMLVTAVWCLLAVWVILAYRGGTDASTWTVRLLLMLVAAAVTTGVVLAVRSGWRRGLGRPLPAGRRNPWIARRPGWQIALFYWSLLGLPSLVASLWSAHSEHHEPSALELGIMLGTSAVGASFMALMLRAVWHRQALNVRAALLDSSEQ